MEQLGVFKIIDDEMVLCGYYDNKDDAVAYLKEIGRLINEQMQTNLSGEYVILPMLYFELKTIAK
jgi:hypothetical protein